MKGGEERGAKAPRSEVSASLRDLNSGSNELPWTEVIVSVTSASGQRAVVIGPGVVFSRDANGCSGRGVRKHVIAVPPVSKRPGVGVVVARASGIEKALLGANGGGSSRVGIGSGRASGRRRQLMWIGRARASAQQAGAKIFCSGGANGRVATSISRSSMNIRASAFAVWRAAWRCVACWIGSRVTGRGAGVCFVSG